MIAEKNGITVDTRTAAPARKMIKCPQKTGINLNLQEDRQRDRRTLLIGILAIAALVTVVVNFGVLQQYRRLDKAQAAYDRDRANSAEQGVWDQNVEAEGENFDVMEDIARRVPLSKIPRPAWDLKQLTAHVLQAEADEEVWQRVWSEEENISFASTPMFLVRGRK